MHGSPRVCAGMIALVYAVEGAVTEGGLPRPTSCGAGDLECSFSWSEGVAPIATVTYRNRSYIVRREQQGVELCVELDSESLEESAAGALLALAEVDWLLRG